MEQSTHTDSKQAINPSTLVELLRVRADQHPDRLAFRYIQDDESDNISVTYAELDRRARAIASIAEIPYSNQFR